MFELIGFWVAVTMITALLVFPVAVLGIWGLSAVVEKAIPDRKASEKASEWLVTARYTNFSWFGGKIMLPDGVVIFFTLSMTVVDLVASITWILEAGSLSAMDVVGVVSEISIFMTPVFAWVGSVALVYAVAFFAIRWGYKASVFATNVNDHMQDQSKHN